MCAELTSELTEPPCALDQVFDQVDLNAAWRVGGQATGTLGWGEPLHLPLRAGETGHPPTHKPWGQVSTLSPQPRGSPCVLLASLPVPQGFMHPQILAV